MLPKITGIEMLPRGIANHSPLLCTLQTTTPQADRLWHLSRYWIKHPTIEIEMAKEIKGFWVCNTSKTGMVWDTFKAYVRGCYLSSIVRERRNDGITLEEAEAKARDLESRFTLTSNPIIAQDTKVVYREVTLLRVAKANKQQLAQTQKIFEQGEKIGRLLAWISKEQSPVSTIASIRRSDGTSVTDPVNINLCFADFYAALYSSRAQYSFVELFDFLDGVTLLVLTTAARDSLEAPITLGEVQQALGSMQTGKIPGVDGLPPEFYKRYMEEVATRMHNMFSQTLQDDSLPPSMAQAIIVVIPKPGKYPQLCSSYRPISLLNSDAKVLTKILARRLNEVMPTLIHEDQSGFM